jgi:hypothetical protein
MYRYGNFNDYKPKLIVLREVNLARGCVFLNGLIDVQ